MATKKTAATRVLWEPKKLLVLMNQEGHVVGVVYSLHGKWWGKVFYAWKSIMVGPFDTGLEASQMTLIYWFDLIEPQKPVKREYQVTSDGRTIWVNSEKCLARLCPLSGEVEVCRAGNEKMGLETVAMESFSHWCARVKKTLGVVVSKKLRPEWDVRTARIKRAAQALESRARTQGARTDRSAQKRNG